MTAPKKPSDLAVWIDEFGPVDRVTVVNHRVGERTYTKVLLMNVRREWEREANLGEIGTDEVVLRLRNATIVELTDLGRQRVKEWKEWNRELTRKGKVR